ncbi:uncharacterized protein LOC119867668 isoform X2 [Canis lupus familiaris]|uniref:uncharacterized protein LOC119867668 isoform X2 n=1 Tax=Canis lupus familiaris TaxID=9615 RepID=UPI0018F6865F|nr:uncharacterized protein LOC119867668 isoform X2 [Canis lupus familiaris]XP_038440183.1 uncharacterized protein LOC119867668 isoform X2 [Canis lupus familiaris]
MRVRLKQPLHHEDLITIEGYISHLTKEEISVWMKTDINYKRIGDTNKWQRNKSKNKQLRLHKKKSLFTVKETINKLKREGSPCPDSLCRTVRRGSLSVRPTQPRDSCAIWEVFIGLDEASPEICSPQSTDEIVISSRNTLTDTPRIMFHQISGCPVAPSRMLPNDLGLSFYFTINRFSLTTSSPVRSSPYS